MLRIDFGGHTLKSIGYPDAYFEAFYQDSWFEDKTVQQIVLDVDKSVVHGANCIDSPFLGPINCMQLSTGVKNLIIAYMCTEVIDASFCGDNCGEWLLRIGELKDLDIVLYHGFIFPEDITNVYVYNSNKIINSFREYASAACKYLGV